MEHEAPPVEMASVIVAATDIPPLTEITKEMIEVRSYPAEYVDSGAASEVTDVIGLQSGGTIVQGQPIMTASVGTPEEVAPQLSAKIPEGMRAMTIDCYTAQGIGGYVKAGDKVDMLGYIPADEDAGISETLEISIYGATVLEAGNADFTEEDTLYSTLTLALTQAQTIQVYSLMEKGEYYFTLWPMSTD